MTWSEGGRGGVLMGNNSLKISVILNTIYEMSMYSLYSSSLF